MKDLMLTTKTLASYIKQSAQNTDMFLGNPLTEKEVHDVCHNLKCGKAGGFDELVPEHYKYGGHALSQFLCDLFNSIIASEYNMFQAIFASQLRYPCLKVRVRTLVC